MFQKAIATLAASALLSSAAPVDAQTYNEERQPTYQGQRYFFGDFFKKKRPECHTSYPEPIGNIPGHLTVNDVCLPAPIAIIPEYGSHYRQLMQTAIKAGIRGDYNTALVNFRRARLVEISKDYLGYSNREALRGINGATVARRYQKSPQRYNTKASPQYFWYYWTGTGNRNNWGRVSYPPK